MNRIPDENRIVINKHLRSRLTEVRTKLPDDSFEINREDFMDLKSSESDLEAELKKIMLEKLDYLSNQDWQAKHCDDFYDSLNELYQPALKGDLRFLDAFNRSYEELKTVRPEEFETDRGQDFLNLYGQLITHFMNHFFQ